MSTIPGLPLSGSVRVLIAAKPVDAVRYIAAELGPKGIRVHAPYV